MSFFSRVITVIIRFNGRNNVRLGLFRAACQAETYHPYRTMRKGKKKWFKLQLLLKDTEGRRWRTLNGQLSSQRTEKTEKSFLNYINGWKFVIRRPDLTRAIQNILQHPILRHGGIRGGIRTSRGRRVKSRGIIIGMRRTRRTRRHARGRPEQGQSHERRTRRHARGRPEHGQSRERRPRLRRVSRCFRPTTGRNPRLRLTFLLDKFDQHVAERIVRLVGLAQWCREQRAERGCLVALDFSPFPFVEI